MGKRTVLVNGEPFEVELIAQKKRSLLFELAGQGDPHVRRWRTVGAFEFMYNRVMMHPSMSWREGGRGEARIWQALFNKLDWL